MIHSSADLLIFLHSLNLLQDSPSWWWPNHGDFEVVISAILTQNTRWENVQKSLQNLQTQRIILPQCNEENLRTLAQCHPYHLAMLIAPSGFANQKASRLIALAQRILQEFQTYARFVNEVDAEWLIAQKGIGKETRDCILNYACLQEVMVVDSYTHKLICSYGFEIHDYEMIQEWLVCGINDSSKQIKTLYQQDLSLAQIYARFHGKIVEFAKRGFRV